MSLLRALLAAKPVRTPLEFGVNENVRIVAIDNTERKRDGEKINRNCYITFTKYDSKGAKMASSEFSYFNLDHTSDYVLDNLTKQVAQMNDIATVLNPGSVVDPTQGYESIEDLAEDLKSKKGCKSLMDAMWEQFEEAVGEHVGEDSELIRVKVVTDTKGKWLQLPSDSHIVESMESDCTLAITAYELKNQAKGLEAPTEEADSKGDSPDEKPKKKGSLANL